MSDLNWKEELPKHHNGKYINSCMVHEFAGYMSRCWDDEGVFEDGKAGIACRNLISYLGSELSEIDDLTKLKNLYESNFLSAQKDYEELAKELQKYKELAKDAKAMGEFYGDAKEWVWDGEGYLSISSDEGITDDGVLCGGKHAREFTDKHKELLD